MTFIPAIDVIAHPRIHEPGGAVFARQSGATFVNANGVIQHAPKHALRHDYDPETGEYLGWLIEGPSTNLWTHSEDFCAPPWRRAKLSIQPNKAVAPDGRQTGCYFPEHEGVELRSLRRTLAVTKGHFVAISFFIKGFRRDCVRMTLIDCNAGQNRLMADYDIQNGWCSTVRSSGNGAEAVGRVQKYPNGWHRISLAGLVSPDCREITVDLSIVDATGGTARCSSDGRRGIYLWGAQAESAPYKIFATSYIPSDDAPAERLPDILWWDSRDFSFNENEGTVIVQAAPRLPSDSAAERCFAALTDVSGDRSLEMLISGSSDKSVVLRVLDGVNIVESVVAQERYLNKLGATYTRVGMSYSRNEISACALNGSTRSKLIDDLKYPATLSVGSSGGLWHIDGHIQRLSYWNRSLSLPNLHALITLEQNLSYF